MVTSFAHRAALRRLVALIALALLVGSGTPATSRAEAPSRTQATPPAGLAPAPGQPGPAGRASQAYQWYNGVSQWTQTQNCTVLGNPYIEQLAGHFVGYYGDIDAGRPKVGDVFYVQVVWAVTGNPCGTGGAQVYVEVFLPEGVAPAFSQQNRARCFHDYYRENKPSVEISDCPQQFGTGQQGGRSFNISQGTWPTASGTGWTLWIPVLATKPLNGIEGNPCTVCFGAAIKDIDGNFNPWAYPKVPVYVEDTPPTITYPTDAVSNVTESSVRLKATLFNTYKAGNAWIQIGTTTNYDRLSDPVPIEAQHGSYTIQSDWTALQPGTTYHWRLLFQTSTGQFYAGTDRTFTTAGTPPPALIPRLWVPLAQP